MFEFVPMPLLDDFLLEYNAGQVLLLAFILSVLGTLPLKSGKVVSLTVVAFGLIFVLTPSSLAPPHYRFLGLALLVIGPMLAAASNS